MRRLLKITVLGAMLCILASGVAYAKDRKTNRKNQILKLELSDMSVCVGQVRQVNYSLTGGSKKIHKRTKLVWKSSDSNIATVNKRGEIKGRKPGRVRITGWINGNKKNKESCLVKVKQFEDMNFSVPFGEAKYYEMCSPNMDLKEMKNNMGVIIESCNGLIRFIKKYAADKGLIAEWKAYKDIDFSKNSILVHSTLYHDIGATLQPQDTYYSLVRSDNSINVQAVIEEETPDYSSGYSYADIFCGHLVFVVVPKGFAECADKYVEVRKGKVCEEYSLIIFQ